MCLAIPGKILSTEGEHWSERVGRVSFGGVTKQISLAYVPDAGVGDYVMVHVGFAISTVDEEEANRIFAILEEMGELAELEEGEDGIP